MLYIVMAAALMTSILGISQQNTHSPKVMPPHKMPIKVIIKTSKVEKPKPQVKTLPLAMLDGVELANLSETHHA